MTSLARRHRDRVMAAKRQEQRLDASLEEAMATASPYELLRASLGNDLAELKNIQSIEAKIARKAEMLPTYEPWVQGILEAAANAREAGEPFVPLDDDILTQVLVWKLDVGHFVKALAIAAHVLRYDLTLPERFKRTAATMVAEEIAEAGLKAAGQGEPFSLEILQEAEELTADEDMPDEVRAKLHKAIGLELARGAGIAAEDGDGAAGGKRAATAAALGELKRALALNSRCGVKKEIERLERDLRKLEATSQPPAVAG